MTTWFLMGNRWHCQTVMRDGARTGRCKISVIGNPLLQEVDEAGLYPDAACHTCMKEMAWDDCLDESVSDAVGRGYESADLAEPDCLS